MDYCGLSAKAGKVVSGADAVREQIIKKKIFAVIIAKDSSSNTKEKFLKLSKEYDIKVVEFGNIDTNSKCIGKKNKAVIGLADKNFSEAILKIIIGGDAAWA